MVSPSKSPYCGTIEPPPKVVITHKEPTNEIPSIVVNLTTDEADALIQAISGSGRWSKIMYDILHKVNNAKDRTYPQY